MKIHNIIKNYAIACTHVNSGAWEYVLVNCSRNQTANICSSCVVMGENIGVYERINSYSVVVKTTSESHHFLIV